MPKRKRRGDPWTVKKRKPRYQEFDKGWMQKYTADGPRGLTNDGVTCYRLGLMQCLLHTPVFLRYIELIHRPRNEDHVPESCVLCALKTLIHEYWVTRNPGAFPSRAIGNLWTAMLASIVRSNPPALTDTTNATADLINSHTQEDPTEFWSALLEMIGDPSQTWTRKQMFELHYEVHRDCAYCKQPIFDVREEHSDLLSIAIPTSSGPDLDTYLHNYFREHVMDSSRCRNKDCRSRRHPSPPRSTPDSLFNESSDDNDDDKNDQKKDNKPTKNNDDDNNNDNDADDARPEILRRHRIDTIRITDAPEVLIIQLKRYGLADNRGRLIKLDHNVRHPLDLDLRAYAAEKCNGSLVYRLHGIECHSGRSTAGGHYVGVVHERVGKRSALVNDQTVMRYRSEDPLWRPWREPDIQNFDVYCLVYMQVSKKEAKNKGAIPVRRERKIVDEPFRG